MLDWFWDQEKKILLKTVKGKNISSKVGKIRITFVVQKTIL